MKRVFSLLSALVLLAAIAAPSARSQELETGYFLGGNPYAFRMNPAFQSERNIFSIALGGTGLEAWSNLGISSLFYPGGNGYLYTFMNDRVSPAEFQRKIGRNNRLDLDARVNLLTLGFWADRRFYTIDLNVRGLNAVSAPSDLFAFLKEGSQGGNSFDFSGTGIRAKEFVELAFGWSKNYNNVFNAGFRVKALVGAAEAEVLAESMRLSMASDRWEIQARSVLNASSPSLVYRREGDDLDVGSIEFGGSKIGPAGYGAALDLGASWNVLPSLTLSAAVLDLGPMRWNREVQGVSPETSYTWAPSDQEGGSDDTWEAEMDEASAALSGIFRFKGYDHIVTLGHIINLIRKIAHTPFGSLEHLTAFTGNDAAELLDQGRTLLFFHVRIDDVHDFILAHLYTSFWSVGHLWQGADEKTIDSPNGVITDLFIL
jgi:hypothetical protein